jgi:hypothetical protein
MYSVTKDLTTGFITISEQYTVNLPHFSIVGDVFAMSFLDLRDVQNFKSFTYSTTGESNTRYLTTSYRISRDTKNWTNWLPLDTNITNFPPFNAKDPMFIDIKWTRAGDSTIGIIELSSYNLQGTLLRNISDGTGTVFLDSTRNSIVIKPPYVYKVFSITDLEIISAGDISGANIKYRFSQDYGRTVTNWEPLTKANITTVRITPIRFFQIEYLVEYTGSTNVKIYDINLIGDFQNVTLDSQKTNLYGSREDCNCIMLGLIGSANDGSSSSNLSTSNSGLLTSGSCDPNSLAPLTPDDISKLFQPYAQTQAVNLLNKLSTDANQIFGHQVVYFLTDPDRKGTDYTFHEYQLYNYVCSDMIKVSVDGNNFPDNQIVMNQFDLSLFDSFEIHIPKDTFKQSFGVEKRPSKEDFLWFCEINRMFQVEHAQQFRNFNNSALYYKIMLKKYVQKSNIIGVNQTITDKVKELTKNSTIDELFGLENNLDKKQSANDEQTRTLTQDVLRSEIFASIDKELIENSTTIIAKTNYDLSTLIQKPAIVYRNLRNYFKVSDNFSYTIWFNINNYTVNDTYNFVDYYDETNKLGFKINLKADDILFTLNSTTYEFEVGTCGMADGFLENTWYCYIINVDQRQRKLGQWIYKRNIDVESDAGKLNSNVLLKIYSSEIDLVPVEFELDSKNVTIYGSDMKMTNIRLFNDVVPESEHNKLLNQYVIGRDHRHLIFADNANMRIILPNLPFNQVDTNIIRGEITKENLNPPQYPSDI